MSAKLTSTKKFVVRTALVTSTTLATIMGAQALASVDQADFSQSIPDPVPAVASPAVGISQPASNLVPQSTNTVSAEAPSIVILRRAGDAPTNAGTVNTIPNTVTQNTNAPIALPNAIQVAPPEPVIQSAPSTQSSR